MTIDRRTQARELAMQALCQLDIQGNEALVWMGRFFREQCEDAMVVQLAEQWTKGAWENVRRCDEYIEGAAAQWKLSRMSQVDRNVLRLSVYQLGFCPDIPGKVIINEAIEIARKYSTEQSPRFINGVLDAILKLLRPGGAAPSVAASGKEESKEEGKEEDGELS
jgi:N utilization substance protein B